MPRGFVAATRGLVIPSFGRPRRVTVTAAIVGAGAWTPDPAAAVAAVAVVALATVWHPIAGIRSSAAAIFVVSSAVAVIAAAPTVHAATAVAVAASAAVPSTAVHADAKKQLCRPGRDGRPRDV